MQQSTIFSILMILLTRRKVTRDYLAERFSISKRTVSRYLAVLEDAGVPITSETGRNGGISLADDYMLDKSFFSEAEAIRIRAALEKTEGAFDDKINRALIEKLDCVQKRREQDRFAINQSDLYIDCEYEQSSTLRPKIKTLASAIEQCRAVDIKYTDARSFVSYRTIEPYTLVFRAGAWYLYAMCRLRGDFRLFKLSRISDLRVTSKSFVKYESRLVEKLGLEYYNEVYIDLELEFFPTVSESIIDWLGTSAVIERGTKLVAQAELPLTNSLIKKLLSFGSSVKVLNPPELVERMKDECLRMAGLYDGGDD